MEKPAETTIYIPRLKKVVLLDHDRKMKVELTVDQLERFSGQMKARGEKATDPRSSSYSRRNSKRRTARPRTSAVFQSEYVTYQCETFAPRSPVVAQQYREFGDLSAQLNAVLNRGWPPFARMQVNAALAEEKLIPRKVALLIPSKSFLGGRQQHFRSEHELQSRLSESDQKRIVATEEAIHAYPATTLLEYGK
ncbi:MAG: hypothetical protein QM811_07300 [Pirellulales bacterium]